MTCIIGVDPGLATFGVCVYALKSERPVAMDVFTSAKGKTKASESEDRQRRALELRQWLVPHVRQFQPRMACIEAMSFPRSARASALISLGWGVLISVLDEYNCAAVHVPPTRIKRAFCGPGKVTDERLYAAIHERYPDAAPILAGIAASRHQHALDALGAIEASRNEQLFVMLKGGVAA